MDDRRRVSQKQEREVAKRHGAKQHAGSGSGSQKHDSHHTPEDVDRAVDSGYLFECKTVLGGKRQITIKADDLLSVERAAIRQGRVPVLIFDVGRRRYVCLTEDDFIEHRSANGGSRGGG